MAKSKSMCCGCYNNFYNSSEKDGCWSFKNAKIVTKVEVGTWQPPPYTWIPTKILSCYHRQGSSFLSKDDCRVVKNDKERKRWLEKMVGKDG
jgi:hypothetical protein